MKIAYCLNSIRYLGGIQRVTIVKANALASISGNEVYIIVTDNNQSALITTPLSDKIKLVDLDVNYYYDDWKSKWNVLKGIVEKRIEHKNKLAKALNDIHPDIVISVGQAEKYMILEIPGKWKKIREMHYPKKYRRMSVNTIYEKMIAYCSDFYDYESRINKYDQIVLLTKEDKEKNWPDYDNISVIPNPLTEDNSILSSLDTKTIITSGRLEKPKNFQSLINAFSLVSKLHSDWKLEIYGEGSQRRELQDMINRLETKNIFLKGYTDNIYEKLAQSSLFVSTSIFEGFGLSIIEAMSCGLPIVSYECPCGPKDIIEDNKSGFLITVNDERKLAEKINLLIEDQNLRKRMGSNAREASEKYKIEKIIPIWMTLFNNLKNGNK